MKKFSTKSFLSRIVIVAAGILSACMLIVFICSHESQFEIDKQSLSSFESVPMSIESQDDFFTFISKSYKDYDNRYESIRKNYGSYDEKTTTQRNELISILDQNYIDYLKMAIQYTEIHLGFDADTVLYDEIYKETGAIAYIYNSYLVHADFSGATKYYIKYIFKSNKDGFASVLLNSVYQSQFCDSIYNELCQMWEAKLWYNSYSSKEAEKQIKEASEYLAYLDYCNASDIEEYITLATAISKAEIKRACDDIVVCTKEGLFPIRFKDTGETEYYCREHHNDYITILRGLGLDY